MVRYNINWTTSDMVRYIWRISKYYGFSTGVLVKQPALFQLGMYQLQIIQNWIFSRLFESIIEELTTEFGDYGLYSKTGLISIEDWTASDHTSSLLFSESTANTYIRNWQGTGFTFAAQGEANELFFGTEIINENLVQLMVLKNIQKLV